ncbi:hypothetical protein PH562_10830 [Rhizobium sp. CNPSo 4062]|uniref:hypothetical protein n=1 Tax=Rhizobium sp. CNPSo 4062 TaxID=3021410 RepID=UPI00254D5089|nr:hypothetical protein [Rhizobium sp. CNPSo 4062]MDK4702736.1 hypothetical protein [Rhizobium sp. CNPSo 4062]
MFTKEWSIPAILTVFLLGVCGLIAYFTWTLLPPAATAQNHVGGAAILSDSSAHPTANSAPQNRSNGRSGDDAGMKTKMHGRGFGSTVAPG